MNNNLQKVILIATMATVIVSSCAMITITISSVSNQPELSTQEAATAIHTSAKNAIQAVDESSSAAKQTILEAEANGIKELCSQPAASGVLAECGVSANNQR